MTQEKKQLLLKDLCARLPYRVIAHASEISKNGIITDINILYNIINLTVDNDSEQYELLVPLSDIKPYLCPMSSMTDDQRKEWYKESHVDYDCEFQPIPILGLEHCHLSTDWLLSHHFDFRDLIPMGLALEAPDNMYK